MRRSSIAWGIAFLTLVAVPILAQQDRLQGRWEGTVQSLQGDGRGVAIFQKSGDTYTGSISGPRGNTVPFKGVKLDGDKVTAVVEVDAPQGRVVIKYDLTLEGEALKGTGALDFGGQAFTFTLNLKRVADAPTSTAASTPPATSAQTPPPASGQTPQSPATPPPQRRSVPQPQQKQALEYFAGKWDFKWIGRDDPVAPALTAGTVTFTAAGDGKFLESVMEGKTSAGPYRERGLVGFDEGTKAVAWIEHRPGGVAIVSLGDWTSPIMIRFSVAPITIKGQTYRLRRTLSVVSATSFMMTEEFSVGGAPLARLGNGTFSKAETTTASKQE